MYRHILKIGNAKYSFNHAALCAFVAEARMREDAALHPSGGSGTTEDAEGALRPVFQEVGEITALYRAYRSTGTVEALERLKTRMEMVSVQYESHALAQEVLSINSCLPFERRVPCN